MAELDPKAWQPVLQDAFHPPSASRAVAKAVLGTTVNFHRSYEKSIPNWRWPLWSQGLDAIAGRTQKDATPKQWWTEKLFGDDYGRESPPRFEAIQVGLNKHCQSMSEGGMVIAYEKANEVQHLVLTINPVYGGKMVEVTADESQKEDVERLFHEIAKWSRENNFFKGQTVDPMGKFLDLEDVDEADLILEPALKEALFRNVASMIEKGPEYEKYGIPSKRGIIMAGPPGTGKTLSMKVLAKRLDCSFIWVTPRHIEELDGLSHIYDFAREIAPTVVLLEDADSFSIDRRLGQFNPMLGELLQSLDGLVSNKGVITILSSNYAEVLDSALTQRPGRFDVKLKFNPPQGPQAFELLKRVLEKRNVALQGNPDVLRKSAFAMAECGASGAFIVEAVNLASMFAVERGQGGERLTLTETDIQEATQQIILSLSMGAETEKSVANEGIFKWGAWYAAPGG